MRVLLSVLLGALALASATPASAEPLDLMGIQTTVCHTEADAVSILVLYESQGEQAAFALFRDLAVQGKCDVRSVRKIQEVYSVESVERFMRRWTGHVGKEEPGSDFVIFFRELFSF